MKIINNNLKGQEVPIKAVSGITLALVVMVLIYVTFETQWSGLIDTFIGKVELPLN